MKTVKIKSIDYEVIEYTKKTKKIKKLEISVVFDTMNNHDFYTKPYKKIIDNLDKHSFSYRVPFSLIGLNITNFKKANYDKQIEALNNFCKKYIGEIIEVGTIESENNYRFIDLEVEESIKRNILSGKRIFMVPSYFYMEGPNGGCEHTEMYKPNYEDVENPFPLTEIGELIHEIYKKDFEKPKGQIITDEDPYGEEDWTS